MAPGLRAARAFVIRMKVVGIQGSRSAGSRSGSLLALAPSRLQGVASSVHRVAVRELPSVESHSGPVLTSVVTTRSIKELGPVVGKEMIALV